MERKYYGVIFDLVPSDIPNDLYPEDKVKELKFFTLFYAGGVYAPNWDLGNIFKDVGVLAAKVENVLNSDIADEDTIEPLMELLKPYLVKEKVLIADITAFLELLEKVNSLSTAEAFCKYLEILFAEPFVSYTYRAKLGDAYICFACPKNLPKEVFLTICSCYTQDGKGVYVTEDMIDIDDSTTYHKYSYDIENSDFVNKEFIPILGEKWDKNNAKAYLIKKYGISENQLELIYPYQWEDIIDNIIYMDEPQYQSLKH